MRHFTNAELVTRAEGILPHSDNAKLVAELADRLDAAAYRLEQLKAYTDDEMDQALQFYLHRDDLAEALGDLADWVSYECEGQGIEPPAEYLQARLSILDIPE